LPVLLGKERLRKSKQTVIGKNGGKNIRRDGLVVGCQGMKLSTGRNLRIGIVFDAEFPQISACVDV
jgi:hypothetical protein